MKRELTTWDYDESVKRMRNTLPGWRDLTLDVYHELWEAREALSNQGARTDLTSGQMARSWESYCDDVGLSKRTVNRWLTRYDPVERKLIEAPDHPVIEARSAYDRAFQAAVDSLDAMAKAGRYSIDFDKLEKLHKRNDELQRRSAALESQERDEAWLDRVAEIGEEWDALMVEYYELSESFPEYEVLKPITETEKERLRERMAAGDFSLTGWRDESR